MPTDIPESPRIVADKLHFTEVPRWHDGRLYFSDMTGQTVYSLTNDSDLQAVCKVEPKPGGIGFAPNGDMLVNTMVSGRILRFRDGELTEYADLSDMAPSGVNDMIVSPEGRCYVGRYCVTAPIPTESIIIVNENGEISESEDVFEVANGMIITPDGKRIIVAESAACRLSVLDLDETGRPVNRRLFAQLPDGHYPDGICADEEGGVWVSCSNGPGVVRVLEGGEITHRVLMGDGRFAYACVLGGKEGRTLYICTALTYFPEITRNTQDARIEAVEVPFRRAGTP